jgi:hypothetical protein
MLRTNRIALAFVAALSLAAASAQAGGEIRLVNGGSQIVHPYFKSNCFTPEFNAAVNAANPMEWVFFGGVLAHTQFTWGFADIIDAKCKNAVIKLTYTLDGEPAPQGNDVSRTVLLQYDPTENTMVRLGDRVVVIEESNY